MKRCKYIEGLFLVLLFVLKGFVVQCQEVPILNISTNEYNQVQIEVNSAKEKYYILKIRHSTNDDFELSTSVTLGEVGSTIITEPLESYPLKEHYQVLEYSINAANDTDGDGIDDIAEYNASPLQGPLNAAESINIDDGLVVIDSLTRFNKLSITKDHVQWLEFLNGKGYVKFIILDFSTTAPKSYFIDSNTHELHSDFANAVNIEHVGNDIIRGQIIYHPTIISNNGSLGTLTFNYSNGHGEDFEIVQRTHELLAANMPFLKNNFSYFVTENSGDEYEQDMALFENSRIPILFEEDVYAELSYWGLNQAEAFGFFRELLLQEIPDAKDIVLFKSLPNALPRVGGIMSSVIQTPLSHVNVRAIQDGVPNAFIRDPLSIDSIANLLDHYIYYKVEQNNYFIREATLEEVNNWFKDLRPENGQIPPLNLDYTTILPLDEIDFGMFDGYGAKCANLSTMRTFGFPDGTIPNGFGIPFYYYQEFMQYNGFFDELNSLLANPDFISDIHIRDGMLDDFRQKIRDADMPNWMLDDLSQMHSTFPQGTSIRCRSSTNNEDLPGFSGAGLYGSKTQHPDEGHISKSIKQVYASLWNLRAFDEREFYRVDHFVASMGVLCHPNYSDEKANGVGVSIDPIYQTEDTYYYLNSQIGEDLITNPDTNSIPEEILLEKLATGENDFVIIQQSNLVPNNEFIMSEEYLDQMRHFLDVIHDEFEALYCAANNNSFAMEIEYKITSDDQLIIKQARPWVTFVPHEKLVITDSEKLEFKIFPNPAQDYINLEWTDCNPAKIELRNIMGQKILQKNLNSTNKLKDQIPIGHLSSGVYIISMFSENGGLYYSNTFVKR